MAGAWLIVFVVLFRLVTPVQADPAEQCPAVFTEGFLAEVDERYGDLAVTAAVDDVATGCSFELNPDLRLTTASAIKLHLLGATLERYEDRGATISDADRTRAERMIHFSHNSPPTSELYVAAGVSGMDAYGAAAGAEGIDHTPVYGITRASAAELNAVALATLHDGSRGSLTAESRAVAREIVAGVHHSQQWGISAARPPGWTALAKNGFFPCASSNCAPFAGVRTWRVASTGVLLDPTGDHAVGVTIMTDGAAEQQRGIEAVEFVAAHVGAQLFGQLSADGPTDRSSCTTVVSGDSTRTIVARLGLPAPAWVDVRWVSGNEGPLVGQLMCAPAPFALERACICPARPW